VTCTDTVRVMLMCGVRKPVIAPVCGDLQEAVNQCLLANRHQSLNCAAEVRAFNQCVRSQGQVINACLLHLSTVTINSRIMFVAVFRVSLITLCAGPASCRTGVIGFLAGWHKKPLNQALVSFASLCAYIGSFLVLLFRFLSCFWLY